MDRYPHAHQSVDPPLETRQWERCDRTYRCTVAQTNGSEQRSPPVPGFSSEWVCSRTVRIQIQQDSQKPSKQNWFATARAPKRTWLCSCVKVQNHVTVLLNLFSQNVGSRDPHEKRYTKPPKSSCHGGDAAGGVRHRAFLSSNLRFGQRLTLEIGRGRDTLGAKKMALKTRKVECLADPRPHAPLDPPLSTPNSACRAVAVVSAAGDTLDMRRV